MDRSPRCPGNSPTCRADPVVRDFQHDLPVFGRQLHRDVARAGMLHGVVQRFLPHTVEHFLQVKAKVRLEAKVRVDSDTVTGVERGELLLEGRHQGPRTRGIRGAIRR